MSEYTFWFIVFAACVTVSHAIFLVVGQRSLPSSLAKRILLWKVHSLVNGTLWLLVVGGIFALQFILPRVVQPWWAILLGVLLIICGVALVAHVRILLGRNQAMGIRFFFPEKAKRITSNIYAYLHNPMYDGFLLVFAGLALALGVRDDWYLLLASFVLLNVGLASVENYERSWWVF